MTRSWEYFGGH